MKKPKVSIIVTAHNYGKYLPQCLDSILKQTYTDYEVIVVDDGSTDNTQEVLKKYKQKFGEKMKIITLPGVGLPKACNAGIRASRGKYIIRLDADDFFDENILLVEATYLDKHPEVDLVYPDYYTVKENGEIIEHVRLLKINDEIKLLHRSPLAGGSMFKRECFEKLGGYNENIKCQEDFDFWIRFINKFKVYNINLPLLYYRQHPHSLSKNITSMMFAKRQVKKEFVEKYLRAHLEKLKIAAIIPARAESRINGGKLPLRTLLDKPLIAYTIEEALNSERIDRVFVSTEDEEIAKVAKKYGAEVPVLRPKELASEGVPVEDAMLHMLDYLKDTENYTPDIVVLLHYLSPLKREHHITEAVDTMLIFDMDSVISVTKTQKFYWRPGKFGLSPLFEKRLLKSEREFLYEENGAIYVVKREVLEKNRSVIGKSVGYIEMLEEESVRIDSEYDLWLASQILKNRQKR